MLTAITSHTKRTKLGAPLFDAIVGISDDERDPVEVPFLLRKKCKQNNNNENNKSRCPDSAFIAAFSPEGSVVKAL